MSKAAWYRVLTSESRGAVAVVTVRGPGTLEVVDAVFRPHQGPPLSQTAPGRLRLGRAGIGVGDEVVAVRVEAETPGVELQCHGGAAAVAAVVRALQDAGASAGDAQPLAPPISSDRIRAEAMEDLAHAPTLKVAEILLDQFHGALRRSLEHLVDGVAPRGAMLAQVDALLRAGEVGVRLLDGWKVVIAGRPNVGKSRLFNALAGFDRSIVNPRPGVTRDVVSFGTAFNGWPVELSDTAGERDTADSIEEQGIRKSRHERAGADLVLLVLDRSQPLQQPDLVLLQGIASPLVVANKCDLAPAWETIPISGSDPAVQSVSAETGEGLADLVRAAAARLVPEPFVPGTAVPFRLRHIVSLQAARAYLLVDDRDAFMSQLEMIVGPPEAS
jgi:tRNA modification GTPase